MTEIDVFWSVFGRVAAAIGSIVAVISGIIYIYSLLPSAKLKKRVDSMEEKLLKDYEHLKKHDSEIDGLKERINSTDKQLEELNEGIQRIGKSQIALLRHYIDGNGVDKMKQEADDLTDFFINR